MTERFTEADVQLVAKALDADTWTSDLAAARAVLSALAEAGRLVPDGAELRVEWAVHWLGERGGIAMVNAQLASRSQAEELGPQRVGKYNITGYSIHYRTCQRFGDGSVLLGPWVEADEEGTP